MIGNIAAGLYGVGVTPSTNSYESIATVSVGSGGQPTIEFTSIPSTYKHLQIRATGLYSASNPYGILRFNNDSGNNYWWHQLQGNGSATNASAYGSLSSYIYFPADAVGSSIPTVQVADILDYTSTSKNKTIRVLEGYDANGSGTLRLSSGLWSATPAAITNIKITLSVGNFNEFSSFALYGIKD
jgi:hypothetical protein